MKLHLYILLTSAVVVLMRRSIQLVLFEGDMIQNVLSWIKYGLSLKSYYSLISLSEKVKLVQRSIFGRFTLVSLEKGNSFANTTESDYLIPPDSVIWPSRQMMEPGVLTQSRKMTKLTMELAEKAATSSITVCIGKLTRSS